MSTALTQIEATPAPRALSLRRTLRYVFRSTRCRRQIAATPHSLIPLKLAIRVTEGRIH